MQCFYPVDSCQAKGRLMSPACENASISVLPFRHIQTPGSWGWEGCTRPGAAAPDCSLSWRWRQRVALKSAVAVQRAALPERTGRISGEWGVGVGVMGARFCSALGGVTGVIR